MARVGEAVAAATEAGANLVGGPDLRISDREAASRSAYAAAYRAARARAEAYAGAAGLKIARVLTIQDGGEYGVPMPYAPRHGRRVEAVGPAPRRSPRRAAVGAVQPRRDHAGSPRPRRFRAEAELTQAKAARPLSD